MKSSDKQKGFSLDLKEVRVGADRLPHSLSSLPAPYLSCQVDVFLYSDRCL